MLKRLFALSAVALTSLIAAACTPIKSTGDFSDVRGRVFSTRYNTPLANAMVSIPNYSMNVKTDANGYFEIRGLPTDWLEIEARHETHNDLKRPLKIEPMGAKYVELYMDGGDTASTPKVVFERNYDIWTTDLYGRKQVNLTGQQPRNIYRTYPVWSAKKDQIGYIGFEASQRVSLNDDGVWVMRADGSMPRRLTSVIDVGRLYHLDWSQDGNLFMFLIQDKTFVYNQQLGNQYSLSGNLTRSQALENYDMGPVWTADASQVITTAYNIDFTRNFRFGSSFRQIYTMDQQGGARRQLTTEGDNYAPAVSHSGSQIAYVSTLSGQPELWVMNRDGSSPRQLTFMKASQVGQPRWTADDNYLLFTSNAMQQYRSEKPHELWALDLLSGKTHMVTNDAQHADG